MNQISDLFWFDLKIKHKKPPTDRGAKIRNPLTLRSKDLIIMIVITIILNPRDSYEVKTVNKWFDIFIIISKFTILNKVYGLKIVNRWGHLLIDPIYTLHHPSNQIIP